jgi:tRNA-binding protein
VSTLPEITIEEFKRLDLRVGLILEARPHPNADRLIILRVDVGDQQKQLVAGLRTWYRPEELVGKYVIVLNNLKPAIFRGEPSNGMLLAATSGNDVVLLTTEKPVKPGATIS